MYSTSLPWSPYSFSTCTIRIGPPFVTWSAPSWRPTSAIHRLHGSTQRGSLERMLIGFWPSFVSSFISHHGAPPPSHSAHAYGPGRRMTHSPSSCARRQNAAASALPCQLNTPGARSW